MARARCLTSWGAVVADFEPRRSLSHSGSSLGLDLPAVWLPYALMTARVCREHDLDQNKYQLCRFHSGKTAKQ